MEHSQAPVLDSKPAASNNTPAVPNGYRVVKVRKPDGTIVKVRRPIANVAGSGESQSVLPGPPQDSLTHGTAKTPNDVTSIAAAENSTVSAPPKEASKKAISPTASVEKASPSITIRETKSDTPKLTPAPVHASKLEATGKAYRILRSFRRVHKNASVFIQAFDSDADVDDLQDGDESLGSDDDSGGDDRVSEDSDHNDHNYSNHSNQFDEKSSSVNHTAAAHVGSHLIAGSRPAQRAFPAPKHTAPTASVKEISESKSLSTNNDPEKESLGAKDLEAAKAQPAPPRSLHRRSADWGKLAAWALVIIFPLLFIGLSIGIAKLQHKLKPSKYGNTITYAIKAAVTAWPIIFAAILAQTLKAFATYRVERGIKLMTLEQLISSHSVASALKQPFILRKINWITLGLLSLWGLSPIASQALQYAVDTQKISGSEPISIYYLNTTKDNVALQYVPQEASEESVINAYSDSMSVLYAAVFQPPSQYQPSGSDPWGNPLVPVYEYIQSQVEPNVTGWYKVSQDLGHDSSSYASYYGIPLTRVDEFDNELNFNMNASYLYFDCPFLGAVTESQLPEDYRDFYSTVNGSLHMNMTPPAGNIPGSLSFISECSPTTADGNQTFAYSVCNFTQTFVTAAVSCSDSNCTITDIKPITGEPTRMVNFMDEFIKSSDTGLDGFKENKTFTTSITELYIMDPFNATEPPVGEEQFTCNIASMDRSIFTKRLSYLINTYYATGYTQDYELGQIDPTQTVKLYASSGSGNNTIGSMITTNLMIQAEAISFDEDLYGDLEYIVHWRWLGVYLSCSIILLFVGVAGVLLESWTISPDILGFASSVARHSKYVKLPETDGTMSGAEKARILGDSMVMMQDVRPNAAVGKIVLGTFSETAGRLQKGRLYK